MTFGQNIVENFGHPILVTGGAGFLGSHLCETLLDKGHSVICLDNLVTGTKNNIEQLSHHSTFKFINADVQEPINLDVE